MLVQLFAELIGTFFLISVVLAEGTAIAIGVTLIAIIFFIGKVSGAHVNPAISFVMWLKQDISANVFVAYVIAQLLGGALAVIWWQNTRNVIKA
jgi:aquaporin Z